MAQQEAHLLGGLHQSCPDTSAEELNQPGAPFTCALCAFHHAAGIFTSCTVKPFTFSRQQAHCNHHTALLCVMALAAFLSASLMIIQNTLEDAASLHANLQRFHFAQQLHHVF